MKILALGDFHGKFPKKLQKRIKKEKFDLIVSPGDFCGNEKISKLFFKYVYGGDKELWEFIGKKKNNQLEKENFEAGAKILKKLNSMNKKIIAVTGNWDPTTFADIGYRKRKEPYNKKFSALIRKLKSIKIVDFKNYKFFEVNFVGYPRSTYPGKTTKHITKNKKLKKIYGKEADKIFKRIKEDNKKYFKKLKEKFDENTIFLSHNCPYRTKLDKIKSKKAHKLAKGKHYGSYLAKKIIKELKPRLVICGHIHENQGKQQIGKTTVINPGAAYEGKAAIIEIDDKKKIKKIKFIR